jgi:hypothetical protein
MPIIGSLPVTLINGVTADATQVMADFNWILSQVNTNSAPLASLSNYLPLTGGTLTGALAISSAVPILSLIGPAGSSRNLLGFTGDSSHPRWAVIVGNMTTEGGGNSGSDFSINRFSDGGALIDTPLTINRASGTVAVVNSMTVGANATVSGAAIIVGAALTNRSLLGQTSGVPRWRIDVGNNTAESGSNTGSDFEIGRFADGGGFINFPLTIARNTGVATFSAAIVNGPSDRTLKENVTPLINSLAKVLQLQGVSFNMIADPDKHQEIGLIAQDVAPVVPEILQEYQPDPEQEPKLALDYPKLVALLIEAVKELTARLEVLEQKA